MSLRLEMLQVARLAPNQLRDSAALVRDFLLGQLNEDGGFADRDGKSDLYYTVFGLEGLLALQAELPVERVGRHLESFGDGDGLDLVHLACLARSRADAGCLTESDAGRLAARLGTFRSRDGGFHNEADAATGTVYGCFLAVGAYQDLGVEPPEPGEIGDFLRSMETADGAYSNEKRMPQGSTNATAAAVTLLRNLGRTNRPQVGDWLLQRWHEQGGFVAAPRAPLPDLLSTATTLHALSGLEVSFDQLKEPCLDFVNTLWSNKGSFYGHWADDRLDCEYTYYGLLALGHLSL